MTQEILCPIFEAAQNSPTHPALIEGQRIIAYQELNKLISQYSNCFIKKGIKKNTCVALVMPNSAEAIISFFALLRIKAIGCFLNTRFPIETINHQIKSINATYVISSNQNFIASKLINAAEKIDLNCITASLQDMVNKDVNTPQYDLNQDASIVFTSGSTGQSKAALYSLSNHFYSAKGSEENIPLSQNDRWLLSLPIYHVGGLAIIFRSFLAHASIIIQQPGAPLIENITLFCATHISLVPTQLYRLLEHSYETIVKLQNLKCILIGGSATPSNLLKDAVKNNLPIHLSYGLTEMTSQVATSKRISSPLDVQKVKILPFRKVKINDYGEVLVSGETLFKGYLENGVLNKDCFNEEWFQTGDLGSLSEGKYLTISGRKDNMFISGGENIYPEEIERVLCQMEKTEQAVVVPIINEEFGFRPVAFIKNQASHHITKQELVSLIQSQLPKFMVPDEFYFWPTDINENNFKVNRQNLIKLLKKNTSQLNPIN